MSRIMWSQAEDLYRGQSLTGTVITIEEDAMKMALRNAGNTIFESEWWLETLTVVFDRWGLKVKQWTDPATQVLRVHFQMLNNAHSPANDSAAGTGPLTTRLLSSGKLNSGGLNSGGLTSGALTSGKLGERR